MSLYQLYSTSSATATDILKTEIPNPVGYLQEICVKSGLSPPIYGIVKVDGPSHYPTFTTFCKVEHVYQEASSHNKKTGKEMVARKILNCLSERSRL